MSEAFPDIKVIAPSEKLYVTPMKEIRISPMKEIRISYDSSGVWKVFKGGRYVDSQTVDRNFDDYPTFWDKLKALY